MPKTIWEQAVRDSADPDRALQYARQLLTHPETLSGEQAAIYAAVFSGSRALSETLLAHPDWLGQLEREHLLSPRQRQGLRRELTSLIEGQLTSNNYSEALRQVRQFKAREMLRIGARDLARLATLPQVIEEISNVADVCIAAVTRIAFQQLAEKFGTPYTQETTGKWEPSYFCVLGMGKLGGQELNYSSDIDVLFVYSGEGDTFKKPPARNAKATSSLKNHQFYARLSEAIIAECTRMTSDGFLYRIDLRLRPEGKTAPLARSISSYESYYAQWGQTWERMMLIKARCVGGDESLAAEFLEMIQPFRYPRSISSEIPREVAEMKERIENEVIKSGELDRNVKLGRGGIREIEFLVQMMQVLNAGRLPFLQSNRTLPTLNKLLDYHLIQKEEAEALTEAYCFLRNVEHRLQMEDNRQTHTLPSGKEPRVRLARLMGFSSLKEFEVTLERHNSRVRTTYNRYIHSEKQSRNDQMPPEVMENAGLWKEILQDHSFREPEHCLRLVHEFIHGPGVGHVSSRTIDNALLLLRSFLGLCRKRNAPPPDPFLSDPDRVLARLDMYVSNYGARSMLYEAWAANVSLFRLLLLAFDRSEYLAELAIRDPDLIDQIEQSGHLRRRKNPGQILADLRAGAQDSDQHAWLRRYYQAEKMRIALRDILNLADAAQTQDEITSFADAFLIYALETVLKKHRLRQAPFAIIGLGKLGGRELIYASDLDIVFVAEDRVKNLPAIQKLAIELMDLLSRRTEQGSTFLTDARLRPDGEKGLLVNTVSGYFDYYSKRAMLWEIQSLSRFRPVAGNENVCSAFAKQAQGQIDFSGGSRFGDWKREIHKMRLRIENERTPAGKGKLAIKTGAGGLMDVEFVAQALCLANGWHLPNTLMAIAKAADEGVLAKASAQTLSTNYRYLMQVERILRRWSFEPESVLPDDPAPFYRVAVRCGFEDPNAFQSAIDGYRKAIRAEYNKVFAA